MRYLDILVIVVRRIRSQQQIRSSPSGYDDLSVDFSLFLGDLAEASFFFVSVELGDFDLLA